MKQTGYSYRSVYMFMKNLLFCLIILLMAPTYAKAHFAAIIPSDDMVMFDEDKKLIIELRFMHPLEGKYLELSKPKEFHVLQKGLKKDLLDTLKPWKIKNGRTWKAEYKIRKPGDHVFFFSTRPYFESAESVFLVQYSKTYVSALSKHGGWGKPLGAPVEIVPMVTPYGLWTGSLFTGKVLVNGKPAAGAQVEVAYMNTGKESPKVEDFTGHVVTTDPNGVFSYAMPRQGWWGFSAIAFTGKTKMLRKEQRKIEEAGLIWVRTHDMQQD